MTNIKKHSATALATAILTVALTIPVTAIEAPAESIRISSYKGSTLEVGERSGLIIGPSGTEYTVTSSAPDIVAMEQVLTFWVAVAKAEGSVEITASNSAGERGTVTLMVGSADDLAPPVEDDNTSLTDNLEIRQEILNIGGKACQVVPKIRLNIIWVGEQQIKGVLAGVVKLIARGAGQKTIDDG